MKTCQACGLPNINERRTCKRCGTSLDGISPDGTEDKWYVVLATWAPLVAVVIGWFWIVLGMLSNLADGPVPSEQAKLSMGLRTAILPWLPVWVVAIVCIPIVWRSARRGSLLVLIGIALFVATVEAVILMQAGGWAYVSQAISGAVEGLP